AGVLLIVDLLFLPWHSIDVGILASLDVGTINRTAVQSPKEFYGILALLLTVVMVTQVALARLTTAKLPQIPVPWGHVHVIAGVSVLVLLLVKLLVETKSLGYGAWLGVLLAGALAFGGYTVNRESSAASGGFIR
ncbi:MAG: hypothetical protein ACR2HV_08710, partial [Acidimicrobiales bacterium]